MERRLSAIICADVAGYSRMMGADEAGTHAAFKAHRSAIYPIILNHGGRIVKNTGDGFLLEFPSVVSAIEAAVAMQQLMAERNSQLPADRVMRFRLGVHMGDVISDEDEVFGDGVNIAVRLEAIAVPGGVAVSAKAYTRPASTSATFVDAGVHRFKNIDEAGQCMDLGARRIRQPRPRTGQAIRTFRPSIEPRSSACSRLPNSATATMSIFPMD